ncbi:hypothetical protein SVAN01_05070 [Stagonosporopsis vannaccii]|nr:hypothetical protein SVAN01_05070 [Stagonosporopsis vannaccii]
MAKTDSTRPTTTVQRNPISRDIFRYRPRDHVRSIISLCYKKHKSLECDWYFTDLVEKRRWFLQLCDYRHNTKRFLSGVREHDSCHCEDTMALVRKLAKTMHTEMQQEANRLRDMVDMVIPTTSEIVRALLHPFLYQESYGADITGVGIKDKGDKGEKGKEEKTPHEKAVTERKEARKKAEIARLAKLMAENDKNKTLDEMRVSNAATRRPEDQKKRNEADIEARKTDRAVLPTDRSLPQSMTKEERKEGNEARKKVGKTARTATGKGRDAVTKPTEEEKKMLRGIRTAEKKEAKQIDQVEMEEEKRQQQLVLEQEDAEESDDGLEDALMDAFTNAAPEPRHKPAPKSKTTKSSGRSTIESAQETSELSAPSNELKQRPKPRASRIVDDSSDDSSESSDSIEVPKLSRAPKLVSKLESKSKPVPNTGSTIKRRTNLLDDQLAAKVTSGSRPVSAAKTPAKSKTAEAVPKTTTLPTYLKRKKMVTKVKTPPCKELELQLDGNCSNSAVHNVKEPNPTPIDQSTIKKSTLFLPEHDHEQQVWDSVAKVEQEITDPPLSSNSSLGKRQRSSTEEDEPRTNVAKIFKEEYTPFPLGRRKTAPLPSPG